MRLSEPRAHPTGAKVILKDTFDLYRSNFSVFLGITVAVQLPVNVMALYLLSRAETTGTWPLPYFALLAAAGFVAMAPLTGAISRINAGGRPGVADSYRRTLPAAVPLAGTFLLWAAVLAIPAAAAIGAWLVGLAILVFSSIQGSSGINPLIMLGALTLFLTAAVISAFLIVLYVWLMFAPSVLIEENRRYLGALGRSKQLVAGRWWTTFGTILLVWLVVLLIQTCLMAPIRLAPGVADLSAATFGPIEKSTLAVTGLGMLITMALYPLPMITTVLLYYDLRFRQEMRVTGASLCGTESAKDESGQSCGNPESIGLQGRDNPPDLEAE